MLQEAAADASRLAIAAQKAQNYLHGASIDDAGGEEEWRMANGKEFWIMFEPVFFLILFQQKYTHMLWQNKNTTFACERDGTEPKTTIV